MKTTIDIPDALYRQAKIRAAERGVTLKTMLVAAFERVVSGDSETIVNEPATAYRATSKPAPARAHQPAVPAKTKRRAKADEGLGFGVNEFGTPIIPARPGVVITNEMIDKLREEEGV